MERPVTSRHGLTRCGCCRAHIRAAERPSLTDCPFCGANLLRGGPAIAHPPGRGGILAASLLAFSLGACGGEPDEPPHLDDTVTAPEPVAEPDPAPEPEPVPEPIAEPEPPALGDPPELEPSPPPPRPTPIAQPTPPPDDPPAVAAYGVAPPDELDGFEDRPAPDMRPAPRYGLAPMRPGPTPDPWDE